MRTTGLALAITLIIAINSFADTGTDSLNFLKIKPSARGASIGDGFVAVADDVNAVFYNPAGLTQTSDIEFSLMHMSYMADINYEYGSFVMPVGDNLRFGAYVIYLNYGSIARTSEDGFGVFQAGTGNMSPNDLAVALSGAMKIGENLSLGVNVKYAAESLDAMNVTGVMADAGVLTDIEGVKVGAAVYNIGTVSSDKAPMGARAGASSKFTALAADDLTAAAGVNYSFAGSKVSGSLGGEWKYENFLMLRGSYTLLSDADSLNLGLGIKQNLGGFTAEVAYNFSLLGDLGSAHRISVGVKLGDDDNYKKSKKKVSKAPAQQDVKAKSTLKYYFKKR